jgi:hypothetical protein
VLGSPIRTKESDEWVEAGDREQERSRHAKGQNRENGFVEGIIGTTIPHSEFGDPNCCGCLNGFIIGDMAEIVCNECGCSNVAS